MSDWMDVYRVQEKKGWHRRKVASRVELVPLRSARIHPARCHSHGAYPWSISTLQQRLRAYPHSYPATHHQPKLVRLPISPHSGRDGRQ